MEFDQLSVDDLISVFDFVIEFYSVTVLQTFTVLEHPPEVEWHLYTASFVFLTVFGVPFSVQSRGVCGMILMFKFGGNVQAAI